MRPKHVWAIRTKLQAEGRKRDLALFNLADRGRLAPLCEGCARCRRWLDPNCIFCRCLGAEISREFFCAGSAAAATVEFRALLDSERQVVNIALDVR